jgi:hypothetical protein
MIGKLGMSGTVEFEVIRPTVKKAPLSWRLRNWFTWMFITSWFWTQVFIPIARFLKAPMVMMYGELSIRVRKGDTGEWIDYGVVSRRVITDAGVTFLRDDWNSGASDINTMNYHGIGTGSTAESAAQTALITESTTALNPNSTRATGTRSTPASNQYRSVGTLTCDSDIAVTEHGFFDQAATGGGTLWDRSVFAAINLVGANPDSIQCTYTVTLASGG